jgi:hypothetical protein
MSIIFCSLERVSKMSLFNPEYQCTCKQCGGVWHYTAKEEQAQKALKAKSTGLKIEA